MNVPKRVRIGPFTYAILTDVAVIDRSSVENGDVRDGEFDHDKARILVRKGLAKDTTAEILLHETLHALTQFTGLDQELEVLERGTEEKVVRRLAPALLDAIRRNPQLVRFLTT